MHERWLVVRIAKTNSLMKILANENFPKSSVPMLQEIGYDISSIGIDSAGISDDEVMNIARKVAPKIE